MENLTQLQEVYFDLSDLIMNNPALMKKNIVGLAEFDTLGELLQYQREKLEDIEHANIEEVTE